MLLGIALATAGAAHAEDDETTAVEPEADDATAPAEALPLVVYAGRIPSTEAAGDAMALASLLDLPLPPAGPLHVTEVAPAEGIRVLGVETMDRCTGDPMDGPAYQASLDALYEAILSLEDARPLIHRAKRSQACAAGPLVPSDIAYVSYLEAIFEHSEGNHIGAEAAFQDVFAVEASYPWDHTFPPDAQVLFGDVKLAMADAEFTTLRLGLVPGTEVWLDGAAVADTNAEIRIRPGRHLVQLRVSPDTTAEGVAFQVPAGQSVAVLDPVTLDAQAPPDLERVATLFFASLQSSGQPAPTHLVFLGGTPAAWRWDVETAQLVSLELPARLARKGRASMSVAGEAGVPRALVPILAGVGGGVLVGGAVLSGVSSGKLGTMNTAIEAGEMPLARPDDDAATGEMADNRAEWNRLHGSMRAGTAMMIGGGVTMAVAIPLGLAGRNRDREVTLRAWWTTPTPTSGPDAIHDDRFQLAITFR